MQRSDDFVTHGYDEVFADDKVDLLAFRLAIVRALRREVKHQKSRVLIACDERQGSRGEQFCFDAFADREFTRNLSNLILTRLLEVNPDPVPILVPEYHVGRIPRGGTYATLC